MAVNGKWGGKRNGSGRKRTDNVPCPVPIKKDHLKSIRGLAKEFSRTLVDVHNLLLSEGEEGAKRKLEMK